MEESRRRFVAALPAGVTGAIAGCGGNESSTPTEESTATPTPTATETPADDAVETPTGPVAQAVTVAPDGEYRFDPASFTVSVGDTVV